MKKANWRLPRDSFRPWLSIAPRPNKGQRSALGALNLAELNEAFLQADPTPFYHLSTILDRAYRFHKSKQISQ